MIFWETIELRESCTVVSLGIDFRSLESMFLHLSSRTAFTHVSNSVIVRSAFSYIALSDSNASAFSR